MAIQNPVTIMGVNSSGDSEAQTVTGGAAHVAPKDEGLDIYTYDNQSIVGSVLSNLNLASAAVPAGVKKVLVEYFNGAAEGDAECCFIRWGAAANQGTCMRLRDGDQYILAVPETGTRSLNLMGQTGVSVGSFVRITPLG